MSKLEVWLRGPLPDVPPLLQPIVHTLLQVQEELHESLANFANHLLWQRPEGVASVAFHLQHITGVLDRLLSYARGEMLNEQQLEQLKAEGIENQSITVQGLLDAFDKQLEKAINQIKETDQESLTEIRFVGRARIPSTQIGLLFHAAEHTTRHLGQLLVTARLVK